ncbi:signal recognition particle protein [Sphingomonas sp. ASV193]|uniref:signal recognition particle protein n=1 Tax=Sphingomonas sp. ASV193 TaxID=3144405 RepID=UPI0032E913F1
MFDSLSDRLGGVFDKLRGRGALSEADVRAAMREVRVALLEADVALPVARDFVDKATEQAVGQDVIRSVTPGQMVVKIVHDALVEMLGGEGTDGQGAALHLDVNPPAVVMMVGLQGSGKTTTTAKLAKRLKERERKKVLMASLDVARPAAQEQLAVLGRQAGVDTLPIVAGQPPVEIAGRALQSARLQGYDVLLLDTAGRLHVDDALMAEMKAVATAAKPVETLLVVDSLTGQDAVNVAKGFAGEVELSGVVLTRMDGDARGGAALSMRAVTGKPIKFAGTGEGLDALEAFHPSRVAGRILGMGDVVSLVERAAETVQVEEAEKLAAKMAKGKFDLDDLAMQIQQMKRMGGLGALAGMLPGMKGLAKPGAVDDKALVRLEAMMSSMTAKERARPDIINAKRKIRIAKGSGTSVQEVNKLLKMHLEMANAMKRLKKLGGFGKLAAMFSGGGMEKALGGLGGGGLGGGQLPGLPGGASPFNLPPGFDKFSKK